jgi:hypothetical protein
MVPIGTIDAKPVPFGWLGMLLAVVVPCSKCLVRFGTLVTFGTSEAKTKPHALLHFFGQLCLLCVVSFLMAGLACADLAPLLLAQMCDDSIFGVVLS